MTESIIEIADHTVLVCDDEGEPIGTEQDAVDLIGQTYGTEAQWIAVPVRRLAPEFFDLSSGVAGGIAQKFVNYRVGLAVVGDVSSRLDDSAPLRDFVRETNRGRQLWFVPDEEALRARLTGR